MTAGREPAVVWAGSPAAFAPHGLLARFEVVRTELAALLARLRRDGLGANPQTLATAIGDYFARLIEAEFPTESASMGGASTALSAAYASAALVDELLAAAFQTAGASAAYDHVVERQLFGTAEAATQLHRHIERHANAATPASDELGIIYRMALSLGFCGTYRERVDHPAMMLMRHGLERAVAGAMPAWNPAAGDVLCPDAYRCPAPPQLVVAPRPALRRWVTAGALALAGVALVGHLLWSRLAAELQLIIAAAG